MTVPERVESWEELQGRIEVGDGGAIEDYLTGLSDAERVLCLSRLDDEHRTRLVSLIPPETAASMFDGLPDFQAVGLIEALEPETAAAIIEELPSDERADLLADVAAPQAEQILSAMAPGIAEQARQLAGYPKDVAGGLMVTEYLAFPDGWSVGEIVDHIHGNADRYRDYVVQYAFVVDESRRLLGVLRLRDLLMSPRDHLAREVMAASPLSVGDYASLDEVRAFFDTHAFFGVPVVDGEGVLVGLVRRGDLQEALVDRSETAYLKTQGIVGGEEVRNMPVLARSRRRLSWLSVNILLNVLAAGVIAAYQETLAAVIALAVFLPIISDMSGCSGNQAVAVSLRELSLGLVKPTEMLRVWGKELAVGLINGVVLGVLIAAVAWAWKGNPYLGLVVGAAMTLNTLVAVSIGGTVPLVLRRMKLDPALASGPILTTVTDMCGFFLILSFATATLPRLT
jgi:magnesium transporter